MIQAPATLVVVEDGDEYTERFTRLLAPGAVSSTPGELRFVRAPDLAAALAAVRAGADGLLLDLDFRRTPAAALVDEAGRAGLARSEGERRRLSDVQGILILRALRAAAVSLPALLFADLDDPEQQRFVTGTLAPVTVVPSSTALPQILSLIRALAGSMRR